MKIIYYSPHPTHDIVSEVGYSTHQRESMNAMRSLGHDVYPLIMGGTEKAKVERYHKDITDQGGIKKLLIRLLPLAIINALKDLKLIRHDKRAAALLRQAITEWKPDLVYERNEYMQDKGTLVCRATGVRHFLEMNSPVVDEMRSFEGPNVLHFLAVRKEKNKVKNTDHILVVSSSLKQYVETTFKPGVSVEVVPNGINPGIAVPDENTAKELRESMGWQQRFIFGFVGSILPYHGVDKLVKAFATVVKTHPECALLVVGDGKLRNQYEKLAEEILPEKSFCFTGKIPHAKVSGYITCFDVAMMPDSNWYGSPVKILEYGWMQKPIIAPDLGPLRDIMKHGEDGVLVKPEVAELAAAMQNAVEKIEDMREMGIHFRHRIEQEFTWEAETRRVLSAF